MLLSVLYIIGITAEGITGALAAGREKWIFRGNYYRLCHGDWRWFGTRCSTWALPAWLG